MSAGRIARKLRRNSCLVDDALMCVIPIVDRRNAQCSVLQHAMRVTIFLLGCQSNVQWCVATGWHFMRCGRNLFHA